MTPALVQREAMLACVALLAAIGALAVNSRGNTSPQSSIPQPVGQWYPTLAGPSRDEPGARTSCGQVIKRTTFGVADPVLPCGVKLYLVFRDSPRVLTQVIDRRPVVPGRRFDLTPALAEKLGVEGVERIRWSYAR